MRPEELLTILFLAAVGAAILFAILHSVIRSAVSQALNSHAIKVEQATAASSTPPAK